MNVNFSRSMRFDRRHVVGGGGAAALVSALPLAKRPSVAASPQAAVDYVAQPTSYRSVTVDGLSIFYREAGDPANPTILLLHGFPSSSHMFRDLIPLLAGTYHLVAPDYPGFGQSDAPDVEAFAYTFDHLAAVIAAFVDAVGLERYSLYMQDYGGPVGFRLATQRPERVEALIVQNTNAYEEGLTELSQPLRTSGMAPRTAASDKVLRAFLTPETTRFQYLEGASDPARISPDAWSTDQALLDRPCNDEIQLALFYDYLSNLERYPEWHAYFRAQRPPTLIAWGRNDPIFGVEGAEGYRRDLPDAELHLLDAGHFALEDHAAAIAGLITRFLASTMFRAGS
ncbi:MAG: alpha/beta hydrolase [Thermomicrobiales bacterium]